jgi:hypothetical protein
MAKPAWFISIIIIYFAATSSTYGNVNDSLVYIEVINTSANVVKDRGSGTIISNLGFIITARHLFEGFDPKTDKIMISLKVKQEPAPIEAAVFDCATNHDVDLCLLYINHQFLENAGIKDTPEIACRVPVDQEDITAAGFPAGQPILLKITGKVASGDFGAQFKSYMNTVLAPGMSGGPIIDKDSKLIGVVFGGAAGSGLTFFTPVMFGRELLGATDIGCAVQSIYREFTYIYPTTGPNTGTITIPIGEFGLSKPPEFTIEWIHGDYFAETIFTVENISKQEARIYYRFTLDTHNETVPLRFNISYKLTPRN